MKEATPLDPHQCRACHRLSAVEKRALQVDTHDVLVAVVNLLFMPGWGCVHLRCKLLLSTGETTRLHRIFSEKHGARGSQSQCYLCITTHRNCMLPVVVSGAMEFLSTDAFHCELEQSNPINNASEFPKLLSKNFDHRKLLFWIKTVP